jgi:autotransporter-associated beta strand protein
VATFLSSSTTSITVNSASLNVGTILFGNATTAPSSYTIGATNGNSILLSTTGQIALSNGFTGATNLTEIVNSPLVLEPASGSTTGNYMFSNLAGDNSNVLQFAGAISGGTTTGSITLSLQGINTGSTSLTGGNLISGNISDGNAALGLSLFVINSGTWTLSGANSYSGKTTIGANGTLIVGSLNSVSGGSATSSLGHPTTVANGTIALGSSGAGGTLKYIGSGETTDRVINFASNGTTGGGTIDQSGAGNLKFTSDFTATGIASKTLTLQGSTAGTGEISGVIGNGSGTMSIAKSGTGTWTLSNANTFSGTVTVNAGTLVLSNTNFSAGNATINSGGNLQLGNNGRINNSSTITDNGTFSVNAATSAFQGVHFSSSGISGSGSFVQSGGGSTTLNSVNTYTGKTSSLNGEIVVSSINSVIGGSATSSLGHPTTVANGTIDLGGTSQGELTYQASTNETTDRVINLAGTTGSAALNVNGTGNVKFTSDFTATGAGSKFLFLEGSSSGTGEIAGAIVDNSSTNKTSVSKFGVGTWTLSGANTYTGNTAINSGTVLVNGNNTGATGNVSVSGTLGGIGTIGGNTTVNSGGIVTGATAGTAGTLGFNGKTLAIGASGTFSVDIGGVTSDELSNIGTLDLSAAGDILSFNALSSLTANSYTLATYGSETGIFNTVNNLPSGYALQYNSTELDLVSVPEPGTWIAGVLVLASLAASQRKRLRPI